MNNLVDAELYQAVAKATSAGFAFSYLVNAKQHGRVIVPHTVIAWRRLTENPYAMSAFRGLQYALRKPERWYEGRDDEPQQARAA